MRYGLAPAAYFRYFSGPGVMNRLRPVLQEGLAKLLQLRSTEAGAQGGERWAVPPESGPGGAGGALGGKGHRRLPSQVFFDQLEAG